MLSHVRLTALLAPAVVALFISAPLTAYSQDASAAKAGDPVVARVAGVDIRESDVAMAEEDLGSDLQGTPAQKRDQIVTYLGDVIIVAKAADKEKFGDTADFKQRMELLRNKLLMGLKLQAVGKDAITEQAMREVYDGAVKSAPAEQEVRARHILVASEEEANGIVNQLRGGADFATLAKEKSKDPGSADGGDLGFFTKEQMVKEFSDAAFKMDPGQISDPVKSQFGWHVIKVEEKRQKQPPAFDAVKPQIETFLTRKAQTEFVAKLRETNTIERLDQPAPDAAKPAEASKPADAPKP